MSSTTSPFVRPEERLATFFNECTSRDKFQDFEVEEVALLLERCGNVAMKCPRTYIILRNVDRLDLLDRLLSVGFSDGWFPVKAQSLPSFLGPGTKKLIVSSQHLIETPALDLFNGKHCTVGSVEDLPFEKLIRIGSGNWGEVQKIQSKIDFKQYALKTIQRRSWGGQGNEEVRQILAEMKNMKALQHMHVVRYIGSYAAHSQLGLVMWPIADMDLARYMQKASSAEELRSTLRGFFGCLAAAVTYLHANDVKHRDIKPQNILVHRSNVLITDFGLSRDSLDTTSGYTLFTPRYAPPEVAIQEQRNESADIWSLGCVFLEMAAALHGYDVDWIKTYYASHFTQYTHYYANAQTTKFMVEAWEASWNDVEKRPLQWVKRMLVEDRGARPPASEVWEMVVAMTLPNFTATTFFSVCCAHHDDEPASVERITVDDDIRQIQPQVIQNVSGPQDKTSSTMQPVLHTAATHMEVIHDAIYRSSKMDEASTSAFLQAIYHYEKSSTYPYNVESVRQRMSADSAEPPNILRSWILSIVDKALSRSNDYLNTYALLLEPFAIPEIVVVVCICMSITTCKSYNTPQNLSVQTLLFRLHRSQFNFDAHTSPLYHQM